MPDYRLKWDIKRGYEVIHRAGDVLTLTDDEAAWHERDRPGILLPVAEPAVESTAVRALGPSPQDRMYRGGETRGHDEPTDAMPGVADTEEVDATPAAVALADEHGIDLAEVSGTGSGGRILVSDVKALID